VGARKRYRKSVWGSEETRSLAKHVSNRQPHHSLQSRINHIQQPQGPWKDVKVTELGVFELFLDEEILGMLVERTNMYAEEKGVGKKVPAGVAFGRPWKKVTPEEMRVFVALVIYMRANRYCGSKGFWRDQEENRQVLRLMNLKCFSQINRY